MNIQGKIESILFVASKPVSIRALAKAAGSVESEVKDALENIKMSFNNEKSGIHLLSIGDEFMFGSNPDNADATEVFIKDEIAGELTKAQLETLTVIAYRGPVTRPELEQIRGVNCALILRNLLMRGLVEEREGELSLQTYSLSFEALRHLGVRDASELPEYEKLSKHEHIEQALGADEKQ